MSGQNLSVNNSNKLKNVNAARKIKNGSPKIREVLRQRFRQRMHERRNDLFMKRRHGLTNYCEEVKDALKNIVHEEFENVAYLESLTFQSQCNISLDKDKTLEIEDETFEIEETMEEQWIIEEYEKILWEQKQILSMCADDMICPICLKFLLQEIPNFVVCKCGLKLPIHTSLEGLKQNIKKQVNAHSAACLDVPKFSVFHEGDNISLCFSCMSCDIFALV